jgi:hypothetical protein
LTYFVLCSNILIKEYAMLRLGKLEKIGLALYPVMGGMLAAKPAVGAFCGTGVAIAMIGLAWLASRTRSN